MILCTDLKLGNDTLKIVEIFQLLIGPQHGGKASKGAPRRFCCLKESTMGALSGKMAALGSSSFQVEKHETCN